MKDQWKGIRETAAALLSQRDYHVQSLGSRLAGSGVEVGELLKADRANPEVAAAWIPGVEVLPRAIYPQRHRGFFGEFVRKGEGKLSEIGLWPAQWATARMFTGTAKGFHIHPPHIPEGQEPEKWFQGLFVSNPADTQRRPYDREQWDVMFFVQGTAEMFLVDERRGLERRTMRFYIEGDDQRGPNNAGSCHSRGSGARGPRREFHRSHHGLRHVDEIRSALRRAHRRRGRNDGTAAGVADVPSPRESYASASSFMTSCRYSR